MNPQTLVHHALTGQAIERISTVNEIYGGKILIKTFEGQHIHLYTNSHAEAARIWAACVNLGLAQRRIVEFSTTCGEGVNGGYVEYLLEVDGGKKIQWAYTPALRKFFDEKP